jgi:hypothetical protein
MKKRILGVIALLCLLPLMGNAQSVAPLALPRYQFFDASGRPLSAGCVFSYSAGTTSQLATWTDASGTVANSNPIILDASGSAVIWFGAQAYKLVLKTAGGVACASGNTVATMDNIPGSNQSIASAAWANLSPGSNAAAGTFSVSGNTWNFGGGAAFLIPHSAGFAPTISGSVGYDDTANRYKFGVNGTAQLLMWGSSTDTFTNKTFDTAGGGNVFKIAGTGVTAVLGSGSAVLAPALTGSGNAVMATSPAITTPTLTTPTINGIGSTSSGVQFGTVATGTITASTSSQVTLTWPTAFANASYTVTCSVEDSTERLTMFSIQAKNAGSVVAWVQNVSGANQAGTMDCIGVHP